jgi:hypothetical protein
MLASKCSYAQALCLKEVHDTRAYEKLGLNWEDFCSQHAGISRITAETIMKRADEFGEAYFRLCAIVRISPDTFRHLQNGVTVDTVDLDGERIPLAPENACKIRAGINRLHEEFRRVKTRSASPLASSSSASARTTSSTGRPP